MRAHSETGLASFLRPTRFNILLFLSPIPP
jgi:hypothetical protein